MMKKCVLLVLLISCLLAGCGQKKPHQYTDYMLFDTVTTILGFGESQKAFEVQAKEICRELEDYHRLFDIYQDYPGINNLKTVNDQAGIAPVKVEQPILDLLQDCRRYWELSAGKVNPGMGSVLLLWHRARDRAIENPEQAELPDPAALQQAMEHCDLHKMVLDFENQTVFLEDPDMQLDVGAIAKGWAAQRIQEHAPEGMLISVGGTVCITGSKPEGSAWTVGIQDPDSEAYLHTVSLTAGSLTTSGDYQRYFQKDGVRYHHIIDPDTGMPSGYWRSVTILCEDAGLADALSTALFVMPREQGQALLTKTGAEALWMDPEGRLFYSPGFPK